MALNNQAKDADINSAALEGQKLGLLLASLDLDPETVQAVLTILPAMSVEQLREFSAVLEAAYQGAKTKDADERLKIELEKIKMTAAQKKEEADAQTMQALNDLEQEIK